MSQLPMSASGKTAAQVAMEVARQAGRRLMERFQDVRQVTVKGRGNVVTDVDREVEGVMLELLGREFPGMAILGEETAHGVRADEEGYVWIVDPLDGSRNYASGVPFFSVVVGLALDGRVMVGVNYDPVRDEMFHAVRGQGAYLNGTPIRVSRRRRLEECVLGMDLSYDNQGALNGLDVVARLWPGMQTLRIMGSSALGIAYAAAGRYDLYFHHHLEPWDQVAGILLVEEAGGIITDRTGRPAGLYSDGIIASSRHLHAEFMRKTEGMAWRRATHAVA